jgi:glycosyltransferase involved in cell wall biosynthesis
MMAIEKSGHKKVFYLSEMAVSKKHGGGLTIQRILGDDLWQFDKFIHVGGHALLNPAIEELQGKVWNVCEPYLPFHRPKRSNVIPYLSYLFRTHLLKKPIPHYFPLHEIQMSIESTEDFSDARTLIVPQTRDSIMLSNRLYEKNAFEYVTWMMDDHELVYVPDKGYNYPDGFEEEMRRHLTYAKHVFVISHAMQKFYAERFDVKSEVLFGSSDHEGVLKDNPTKNVSIQLAYFGAVSVWQDDALQKLVEHLEITNATLDIYTHHVPNKNLRNSRVTICKPVSANMVKNTMRNYDAIVLPLGFIDQVRHLSEFNYATKMSEYLASGVPILVVGPSFGAMTTFLKERECAIVIDEPENTQQWKALRALKEVTFRNEILNNAKSVSQRETSTEKMREIWNLFWN